MKIAHSILALGVLCGAAACDVPSNLSTGLEQPPKSQFAQSPTTLPTNPSTPSPSTPRLDDPSDVPAEDPAAGGSSHSPRTIDSRGDLTTDPVAAANSANPNKPNATRPYPQ